MSLRRSRFWLLCLAVGGCFGGPISDFPGKNVSAGPAGSDRPTWGGVGVDTNSNGTPDSTTLPPPHAPGGLGLEDAGTSLSPPSLSDPGVGEFGPPTGDAGTPHQDGGSSCVPDAGPGMCQGALCGISRAQLEASAAPGGACATDSVELNLVCDDVIARVVANCQEKSFATGNLAGVDACAKADPAVAQASADCVDCYLADNRCTLSQCLLECLAGSDTDCASCRSQHCSPAFSACSGLKLP